MIGKSLLHYHIVEKIGEGGMGVVYKARDTHLDRFVAVKVLPAARMTDPERKRRFIQEAKAASALNHPNIVTIHDINSCDGADFIAMEFIAGKTLDQLIPRQGLRLSDVLHYATQIAEALARAHAAGIIHRDLKPGNVMVAEGGLVKLLDFGLAKLTDESESSGNEATATAAQPVTEEGSILGTASYMSPEQAEGRKLDARSDIFSFGVLLYEMITGKRPFSGDSRLSTMTKILRDDPKPIAELTPEAPRDLDRIVQRCLRKEPERRWQTMQDLRVALVELKEESDSGRLKAGPAPVAKKRRWQWIAASAALAVVAAIGYWRWPRTPAPAAPAPQMTVLPLTSYSGMETDPAFSPDGTQVAFRWNGGMLAGPPNIYLKLVGAGEPIQLTSDPAGTFGHAWSPDGRWIAFCRRLTSGSVSVFLIPALGGTERLLVEDLRSAYRIGWSADSQSILFGSSTGGISMKSIVSGETYPVTSPGSDQTDAFPALSPDGGALAFCRGTGSPSDIFVQKVSPDLRARGSPVRLSKGTAILVQPEWTPDGREIVYLDYTAFPGGGPSVLWRIPASGGEPRRISEAGEAAVGFAISRKGNRLAFTRVQRESNIMRVEVEPDGAIRKTAAPFLSSSLNEENPQYSPDGKRVVFSSMRGGSQELWVARSDGTGVNQITNVGGFVTGSPRWSPDGKWIVYNSRFQGKGLPDIFLISADGGNQRRFTDDPADEVRPSWSADGRFIYFASTRKGRQLWKAPVGGGPAAQVTQNGGTFGLESPDGKWLYYTRGFGGGFFKAAVSSGAEVQVAERLAQWNSFAVTPSGVYYVRANVGLESATVYFVPHTGGTPKQMGTLPKRPHWGFSFSPDRKYLIYSQFDISGSDLMLIENFR